jgi:hypothetical protein
LLAGGRHCLLALFISVVLFLNGRLRLLLLARFYLLGSLRQAKQSNNKDPPSFIKSRNSPGAAHSLLATRRDCPTAPFIRSQQQKFFEAQPGPASWLHCINNNPLLLLVVDYGKQLYYF